jgi:hypothetical protein
MMKLKSGTSRAGPKDTSFTIASYIVAAPPMSYSGASPLGKTRRCSLMSMRGFVGIMLHRGAWLGRVFDKDFIG